MDAVATVREQFSTVFGEWAGEAPLVLADGAKFDDWASQAPTLYLTAEALGVDTRKVLRTLTGDTPPAPVARSPRRKRTRQNGAAPTGDQILTVLQAEGPMNQSQLADRFKTTRQTIAKRLDELVTAGSVERSEQSGRMMWAARELAAV